MMIIKNPKAISNIAIRAIFTEKRFLLLLSFLRIYLSIYFVSQILRHISFKLFIRAESMQNLFHYCI